MYMLCMQVSPCWGCMVPEHRQQRLPAQYFTKYMHPYAQYTQERSQQAEANTHVFQYKDYRGVLTYFQKPKFILYNPSSIGYQPISCA